MAFKPGRQEEGTIDFKRLLTILNQTHTSNKNNPLYQFCKSLLDQLKRGNENIQKQISAISGGGVTPIPPVVVTSYYDSPLTDGDEIETSLIFVDGDCIIVQVPNIP